MQPISEQSVGIRDPERFLNREFSWLDFNRRVLAMAEDQALPLLERVKFVAIFSQNLDEFFQVRVAGLKTQQEAGLGAVSPDGHSPAEQLAEIRSRVLLLGLRRAELFTKELVPALAERGIRLVDWRSLEDRDRRHFTRLFEERIFPVLTPLSVDPAHPFPYISNLSLNLAVIVRDPGTSPHSFARLKVPPLLPRFLASPDGERFVPVEQVIAANLEALFPGMEIVSHCPFRVTRNAKLEIEEEEAEDLLREIELGLRRRRRMSDAVRLEVDSSMSDQVRRLLTRELSIEDEDVYDLEGPLDLGRLWELYDIARPELKDEPWMPATEPRLSTLGRGRRGTDLFAVLREGDVLVQHPYDSFHSSVEAFLSQAAEDPAVLAIKHTLYRTGGPVNPIVRALIRAAEAGKEVVALIELKARFDEQANIEWARRLEQAGVHVVYGLVGLKAHAKIALIVRQEADGIRSYCHVGTGNYNPLTATAFEDVGLLSADPELGADLTEVFNHLTGCSRERTYRKLLVAPATLRTGILEEIHREMEAPDGCIVMKMNNLSDPGVIDALYAASQRGVEVDLVVRSICCLRPGIPGLSERIRVRSILGRYLEHSRIFRFGSATRSRRYFIGSADLMQRNLDQRVEVVAPVEEPELQARLDQILSVCLADDELAWELGPDGSWSKLETKRGVSTHRRLQDLAHERGLAPDEAHALRT